MYSIADRSAHESHRAPLAAGMGCEMASQLVFCDWVSCAAVLTLRGADAIRPIEMAPIYAAARPRGGRGARPTGDVRCASVRQRPSVKAADDRGRSRAYARDWPVMVLDVVRRRTEVAWLHFRRLAESGCSCGGRYVHW